MRTLPFVFQPTLQLTTNKANWSGEDITVEVDLDNKAWRQYDSVFYMEFKGWDIDDPQELAEMVELIGPGSYKVYGVEWDEDYVLATVNVPPQSEMERARRHGLKPYMRAYDHDMSESALTRESENYDASREDQLLLAAIEAAVRIICNTV